MVALLAHNLPDPSGAPLPMPALTMTRSMPPNSSESSANTFGTCSWSLTSSAATATEMPGCALDQFGLQFVEPVDAAGAQREVAALGRKCAGHALTEP